MKCLLAITALSILGSCNSERPTETKLHDDIHGIDVIVEHLDGPALSQPEDRVSVLENGDRKVIFEGYGGTSISLISQTRGILLLTYCGGVIQKTESFLLNDAYSNRLIAVKVQPVVSGNLQINGREICGLPEDSTN